MVFIRTGLVLFLFTAYELRAQDVTVSASTNRDSMSIGETLVYTITISHSAETKLLGEPLVDFSDFELTQIKKYEPSEENGKKTEKTDFVLTTFNIDTFLIPAPKVLFLFNKDTLIAEGSSKLIMVTGSIDTSFKDIRPEKPIIEGDVKWWLLALYAVLVIAAAGGLIYLAVRLYRRYKFRRENPVPPAAPEIIRTPEEIALEALEKLKGKELIQKGDYKQFHVEVSDIVRMYIEGKFRVLALESTTSDLIAEFRQKRFVEENYISLLRRFLEVCDLVKFAKYIPSHEECTEVLNEAYNLIKYRSTKD